MGCSSGPDIIQDGLVFCLDAASLRSYPKTGTSWTDLKNSKVGSFVNMTSSNFSEDNGGCINFGGTNGYIQTNLNFSPGTHYEEFTCAVWCKHGTSAHSGYNALMVSNYGGTPIPFNMYAGGNGTFADKFVLYTRVGGSSMQLNSVSDINDDEWHYCVGTRAGIGASSRDYSVDHEIARRVPTCKSLFFMKTATTVTVRTVRLRTVNVRFRTVCRGLRGPDRHHPHR